jgi:iron complex transport system substrate-binding protein
VDSVEHLAGLLHPDRFAAPPPDAARPLSALWGTPSADD